MPCLSLRGTGISSYRRKLDGAAVGLSSLSSRLANTKMAGSTPPDEFKTRLFEVKGFREIKEEFLRCSGEVGEEAICLHCKCIPREIYRLLCPKHGLCIDCKNFCEGYYCPECRINTKAEQLKDVRPNTNYKALCLWVLCQGCDKEMMLGELEEHYVCEHMNEARMEESKVQVKTDEKHLIECQKYTRMYPNCDSVVLTQELGYHQITQCPKKFGRCDACFREMPLEELNEHRYKCPKMIKTCPKCNVNVSNEDLKNHWTVECQKRVVYCGQCTNAIPFDEQGEHEKECPKRQITCVDCGVNVPRMDHSRHQSWCPERLVPCKLCKNSFRYSKYESHLEECSKAAAWSAACEDDASNEGLQCNQTPASKVQKVFGTFYNTQARSEEMRVHRSTCSKEKLECPNCGERILGKELTAHMRTECKKRPVDCDACNSRMPIDQLGVHIGQCEHWQIACLFCKCKIKRKDKSKHCLEACPDFKVPCKLCNVLYTYSQLTKHMLTECPKVAKECLDCFVPVVNEVLDKHLSEECQKRVELCQACCSPVAFDELSEHDKVCEDKRVACEECHCKVLRKEMAKHLKESCSQSLLHYEACEQEYTCSDKMARHQQFVQKTYLCVYCSVELNASDDRDKHHQICYRFPVECPFKGYGCEKKGPRQEMSEHVNNPHNALLNQVIINLQERLEKMEKPLCEFIEQLRRRSSSK